MSDYGLAAWGLVGEPLSQADLLITLPDESELYVDDIEIAQFIYLLVRNSAIRGVIDSITAKVVLILGRFSPARKPVLDALRDGLREMNLVPVLFDFERPSSKDVTGTVEMLARMARFVLVDLTDPSSVPHELATIVPFLRTTPVIPLRRAGTSGYGMFDDLGRAYPWVQETYEYPTTGVLLEHLPGLVRTADHRAGELRR